MRSSLFKYSLLPVFCLVASLLHAQKAGISGKVYADSTKEPLANVTASIINLKDSMVENMVITDKHGRFVFSNLNTGEYNVLISALGYTPLLEYVRVVPGRLEYHLDSLMMKYRYDTLAAVTVIGRKIPVVIKNDTTEFNADAFKVSANATVEELLKAVPTLQVEKDGTVKAQGEKISRVMVDGKPFFGGDTKTAIQNLPADIIEKIQVIDEKTEQAKNTKVDDGEREKVLNLVIKKDRKKGVFGTAYAGYGSGEKYEARLNANYFDNEKKLSLIAWSNNTGRTDNSSSDANESSSYNTRNGTSEERQVRISYNDQLGKKFSFNSSASLSKGMNTRETTRNRQTFYGDSSARYYEESYNKSERWSTNVNLGFDYEPDTLTRVRFSQGGGFNKNVYNAISRFNSFSGAKMVNEGNRNNTNESGAPAFNGQFSFNRRLGNKGRNLFFNIVNNINSNIADNLNNSENNFFPLSSPDYQVLLNQLVNVTTRYTNINSSLAYNEPLSKRSSLSASYNFSYGKNNSIKEAFDFNNISQLYDVLNDSLSNTFNNYNYGHSIGLSYLYSGKKGGFGIGVRMQDAATLGRSVNNDSSYRQHFRGVTPNAHMFFGGRNKRFNLNYNLNIRPPQAWQLQPVVDNTNPLYLRLGNPNLKFATTHNINFGFNYSMPKKEAYVFSNGNINTTMNQVVNSTRIDKATGVQVSQPVNLNGAYYFYFNAGFSAPLKPGKQKNKWFFTLSVNDNFSHNVSLLNDVKNIGASNNLGLSGDVRMNLGDWLTMGTSVAWSYQRSKYSVQQFGALSSSSYSIGTDMSLRPGKLTEIKLNYDFRKSVGQAAGFNRDIHMVNADILQYFSKKKLFWARLKVYDLLKQNTSIYRFGGENYIEDYQSSVLTRFFLLSLNYRLNKFTRGAKK